MRADQVTDVRERLGGFVGEVFASLVRKDQRATGSLYVQGLMLEGRRKSMQPMGERLGIDYQRLQQFVSASPWLVEPVRAVLAGKALELIRPEAWVVDDTGFAKDGTGSPGGGPAVLGHPREGGQLPDRRVRARGHRCGLLSAGLAVVPARVLGRDLRGQP